jgi:hypothetical protein
MVLVNLSSAAFVAALSCQSPAYVRTDNNVKKLKAALKLSMCWCYTSLFWLRVSLLREAWVWR